MRRPDNIPLAMGALPRRGRGCGVDRACELVHLVVFRAGLGAHHPESRSVPPCDDQICRLEGTAGF